jgi:hypothetical protein
MRFLRTFTILSASLIVITDWGYSQDSPQSGLQLSSPGLTQCTVQVHSDLDPFEISIYWIGPPDVPEGFRMAHTLAVSAPGSGSESLFEGLEAYYYEISDLGGYLITEDMNFDGYIDFRLMKSPSAGPNTSWYFWLFDPDQGGFYRPGEFDEFDLVSPEFLQDDKMIRCFHRDGMGEYGTEYYILEGDLPVLTRSERTVYTGADSSVTTVTELIDGEMIVTEQKTEAVF